MLDFDGTLAPIVADPRSARMDARTRAALGNIAQKYPVAIITGRSLAFIRRKVTFRNMAFAGNHGFEFFIHGKAQSFTLPKRVAIALEEMRVQMRELVRRHTGVVLEDKTHTLSLHYRFAPRHEHAKIRAAVRVAAKATKYIRIIDGVLVYNILPAVQRDKGVAATFMYARLARRAQFVPLFIGDDHTDEDAFKALRRGITIKVGKSSSDARYYLRTQRDVATFLQAIADMDTKKLIGSSRRLSRIRSQRGTSIVGNSLK